MAVTIGSVTEGNANAEEIKNNSPDSELYEKNQKYLQGSLVKFNDKIYLAKRNVPSDVDLDNPYYWEIFMDAADSRRVDELFEKTGNLDELETESKDNLVAAINEVGSIQSDWNQNDETKKDYIKNRTHWVEEKIILEETTFTIEEGSDSFAFGNFPVTLSAGDICTVVYDGKTYTCTVFEFGTDIAGIGCDAFEIAFQKQPDGLYAIAIGAYAGGHTISILQTTYHTIPDEFIPWEESPTADSILYTAQSLTEEQQAQARANIGADLSTKMDANNPVGTGSFSMNRKAGTIVGVNSHAEGNNTTASRDYSHAEGNETTASGYSSHSEGVQTTASGKSSHAEGSETVARGEYSHAEGIGTTASGSYSHAEGSYTTASGPISHAEGASTKASGYYSHAEGTSTTASQFYSHAEGYQTTASGQSSHAEGYSTNNFSSVVTTTDPTTDDIITAWKTKKFSVAKGDYSHVEGKDNLALNNYSHAEGYQTTASQSYSHAEGYHTIANGTNSHVQGKCNIADTSNIYADIIGNGTSDTARSNAATVDWSGNAWFAGDVYTGSTSGTNKDDGSKKLATEEYVDSLIVAGGADISLGLTSAAVGQTIKVKAIDDSGKPTEWEAADMSEGVALDTTLTQSGQAADAKAVGDALAGKQPKGDYLTQDTLQSATDAALAQAKASGEFDGADGKSAYQYAQDGGYTGTETEFAEKLAQEQLTGTTDELTPTQVYDAVSAGIPVKVQYIDSTYGLLSFMAFNVAESLNVIVSQTIVNYNDVYILAELNGGKSDNTWGTAFTTLAEKTDIPSELPNPNALTFTGAVTGSYNGSAEVTVNIPSAVTDDHINSLIDAKLGVIENGSY